ncbi:hypothetical protein [Embleya scabrispora]|nr:hypothetical protein [Embleya scabrispora]
MIRTCIAKAAVVAALAIAASVATPVPAPLPIAHTDTMGWQ